MPTFYHPAILWGLILVGVPVLIHLINMMRHRRVAWAAMEFLLVSQKKNQRRVLLRQLLLLLLRMLAIAAIVLMLAQPFLHDQWGRLFGEGKTHHIVLLDDSFSMNDRWADACALDSAHSAVWNVASRAGRQGSRDWFTLLRFSRSIDQEKGIEPDFHSVPVDDAFLQTLDERVKNMGHSQTAVGPLAAVESLDQLLADSSADQHVVYIVSDFRRRDWAESEDLKNRLMKLRERDIKLYLVNSLEGERPNLAITDLTTGEGLRAAGVPLTMEVAIHNYGGQTVDNTPVRIMADERFQPPITVPRIAPGETIRQQFSITLPDAGQHTISAQLELDSIADDNRCYQVVDLSDNAPVLLIDGGQDAIDAKYLSAALAPSGPARTGLKPRIESPRFLSTYMGSGMAAESGLSLAGTAATTTGSGLTSDDTARNPFAEFHAIFLLNVDHLEQTAIDSLERYVKSGGGVGVFLGPETDVRELNESWYRDGNGFFPIPVDGQDVLLVDRLRRAPDLQLQPHPIFTVFQGKQNPFIATVGIERYFATPQQLPDTMPESSRIIARLRNGSPLAIEQSLGEGRVIAFMTTAAPTWNNWGRGNPSYVITMLELITYLGQDREMTTGQTVGGPIELDFDGGRFDARVRFQLPKSESGDSQTDGELITVDAIQAGESHTSNMDSNGDTNDTDNEVGVKNTTDTAQDSESGTSNASRGNSNLMRAVLSRAETSGVYEVELSGKDGRTQKVALAVNVDPTEGDPAALQQADLAEQLPGVLYEYREASSLALDEDQQAGFNLAEPLLYLLLLILIGEQFMSYAANYHQSARPASAVYARDLKETVRRWRNER